MANIASNPWSFTSSDVVSATIAASATGLVSHADGSVTLTTTGVHGLLAQDYATVIGATNAAYNGFYRVLSVTSTTVAILLPYNHFVPASTAASGGGTVIKVAYPWQVRIEDISWQNASAAGQKLIILDRNGQPLWEATATGAGAQNRGKLFWSNGFVLQECDSGIVLVTIN